MSKRRVVISGLGCVTSLGENVDEMFSAVCEGTSGISTIEAFDTSEYPVKFGGEVKNFNPAKYFPGREAKRMDRFTQMALASAMSPSCVLVP